MCEFHMTKNSKKKNKLKIVLRKRTRTLPLRNRKLLIKALHDVAEEAGLATTVAENPERVRELHVAMVGTRAMRALNVQFLEHDWPTDVLAFDMREDDDAKIPSAAPENDLIGEVYVCPQVARRACREYNTSVTYELMLYIVHGLLHLAGERDKNARERQRMKRREQEIMNVLQNRYDLNSIFDCSK